MIRKPYKTGKRNLVGLSMPYLAALTPKGWDIELIDQQLKAIDFRPASIGRNYHMDDQFAAGL